MPARRCAVLAAIIALYLSIGGLYAVVTPAWQVPDEPAHYNYVEFIAERRRLPTLSPGDYPAEYLETIKSRRFPADMSVETLRYESHQPPLYYLSAAPLLRLGRDVLGWPMPYALRFWTLVLGGLAIGAGYLVARSVAQGTPHLALGAAAFSAFLPMHLAMTAAVNNDALVELLLAAIAWQLLRHPSKRWSPRANALLGVSVGLALITKLQAYVSLGLVLVALVWDTAVARAGAGPSSPPAPTARTPWRSTLRAGATIYGVAGLIALPWLARNMLVYGWRDPFAMVRHAQVVVGQLTARQYVADHGIATWLRELSLVTFRSFWGQFGWMSVPLDERVYAGLAVLAGLSALGLLLALVRCARDSRRAGVRLLELPAARSVVILVAWAALSVMVFMWYNTQYVQFQGRYLFPALVPWGLAFVVGIEELVSRAWRLVAPVLALGAVVALGAGMLHGDIPGFSVAMLAGSGGALWVAGWLEQRRRGIALVMLFGVLAALAIAIPPLYIVPALTP